MAQTLKLKRSAVSGNIPSVSDLALGEIAINTYDGTIFIKKNDGSDSIVTFEPGGTGNAGTIEENNFTGNGSTTAFTLSNAPSSEENLLVFIDSAFQNRDAFTISGTTLTFDDAPDNATSVRIYHVIPGSVDDGILTVAKFAGSAIVTEAEGIASNDNDTTLPTSAAVKDYVDSQVATADTLSEIIANGNTTGGTDIAFADNDKAIFGAGSDLQIYHDGSDSYIKNDTGRFQIFGDQGNVAINVAAGYGNAVSLEYANSTKLRTTSSGVIMQYGATFGTGGDTILENYQNGTSGQKYFQARNTFQSGVTDGSIFGGMSFRRHGGTGNGVTGYIRGVANGTSGNMNLEIITGTAGSLTQKVLIKDAGVDITGNIGVTGDLVASGRIKTTNGLFQADEGNQHLRQYEVSSGSGAQSFLLGKIKSSNSSDGGVTGTVKAAYDFGDTVTNANIHFTFSQRSGTEKGHWWYENTDDDTGTDVVSVKLIDDGSNNYYVWLYVGDYVNCFVETTWRQVSGSDITDSGSIAAGTITTGTTLFDTANDPTSEHHIGGLYAHNSITLPGANLGISFDGATKLIGDHSVDGLQIRTNDTDAIVFKTNGNNARLTIGGTGSFNFHSNNLTSVGTVDGRDVATDGTKLDTIETSATADQTQSEINALGITATGLSGTPNVTVGNITTTGYLRGPSTFTIDPATHGDDTGTLVIAGNLQVDGTTTTINSTTLTVDDKLVTLASGSANAGAANGAGIEVDITGATNPSLTYDGTNDEWDFNKDINITGNIAVSGTVDGVDIAARDAVLTSTTTTANAALPKAGGTMTGNLTVNAIVDADNYTINGGQGTDGQLLTSTGSGVAWEDAPASGPTFKTFGTSSIMVGDSTTGTINAADYNTGLGIDVFANLTTGDKNTVVGFEAGNALTVSGENTLIGYQAGKLLGDSAETWEAAQNTFIGYSAGRDVDEGVRAIAIGYNAMMSSIGTTTHDVAIGYQAMQYRNSNTGDSVAIGAHAMRGSSSTSPNANRNVAVGSYTLEDIETGAAHNTSVGWYAGKEVTSGFSNTFLGAQAGNKVTTGDLNTFLGKSAGSEITTGNRNIILGSYNGNQGGLDLRTASNNIVLSDGSANIRMVINGSGNVGIGTIATFTTGGAAKLSVAGILSFGLSNSDMSYIRRQGAGLYAWQTYNGGNTGQIHLQPYGGNVGIGTTAPQAKLQVEEYGVDTTTTSTTATTQVAIHTFAAATFRSARFTVQITNSTDSTYHLTEILMIHDGTTPSITEYGTIFTGSAEATFDADISSGNVRLLATPATTDSMAFKVVAHTITT